MRGSVNYQMNILFKESGIFTPGTSRHQDKQKVRQQLSLIGEPASSTALGAKTGLYSFSYAEDCKDTWHKLGHFAREEFRIRDMLNLRGAHVEAYLLKRVDDGISYRTWGKESSHLGKLEVALQMHFFRECFPREEFGIYSVIRDGELREYAKQRLGNQQKEYGEFRDPITVMDSLCRMGNEVFELVAYVQWQGGARRREACLIRKDQLQGIKHRLHEKYPQGQILLTDTKGGRVREISVAENVYLRIEHIIERYGELKVSQNSYANAVRDAARQCGEMNHGTHAWRYCFARSRYQALTRSELKRLAHEEALQQVSWELGHSRATITCHYLR